jgi:hypothetical protein
MTEEPCWMFPELSICVHCCISLYLYCEPCKIEGLVRSCHQLNF